MMTRFAIAFIALVAMTAGALSQQRTLYDNAGRVIGRSSTDSQGSTTFYDATGKVIRRETTTSGMTTIYDARGRNVGRFTTNR